jgi:hypothetical protein
MRALVIALFFFAGALSVDAAANQTGCGNRNAGASTGGGNNNIGGCASGSSCDPASAQNAPCGQNCFMSGGVDRNGNINVSCTPKACPGGGGGVISVNPPPPPPARSCAMNVSPSSVTVGGGPVTVSVTPATVSRAIRNGSATIATLAAGVTSGSVNVSQLPVGAQSLSSSFQSGGLSYSCSAPFTITPPRSNLSASINATGGTSLSGTARIQNSTANPIAGMSERRIEYRLQGAQSFRRLYRGLGTYAANQTWTRPFSQRVSAGTYEVCVVADRTNAVDETNETDNRSCTTVVVTAAPAGGNTGGSTNGNGGTTVPPSYGVVDISSTAGAVRRGNSPTIVWELGGRTACTVTGSNGDTFTVPLDGSRVMSPITSETIYTLVCAEDGATDSVAIRILPQLQEI